MPNLNKKSLYQGSYRQTLNDPDDPPVDTPQDADGNPVPASATPADESWRKRYGDLRSYSTTLTERVKELENQLLAAQRKEVKIPSTQEELAAFAQRYPDIYRHIRSVAMAEVLQERENLNLETKQVKDNLEKMERELGYKKIIAAHPDFEAINASEEFHTWANVQPKQIQEWLFENSNPDLCIKALDLYRAETGFKKTVQKKKPEGADVRVPTRTPIETPDMDNKKIWKASEIQKMHPKAFEKFEDEIELARVEGRIDPNA